MAGEATQGPIGTGLGVTARRDAWWIGPLVTGLGFGVFVVYTTFRGIYNQYYLIEFSAESAHILSPFYSPLFAVPDSFPTWFSPAFFILWAPGGFRMTCYYYRKFYYRAYFMDPPACAVGELQGTRYRGETGLLIFQNLHRYMLPFALALVVILSYDAILACIWPTEDGTGKTFGISVATLVLGANAAFIGAYTFGCHSLRHFIGGRMDCFTCDSTSKARYNAWCGVSKFNEHHQLWAWVSLISVMFADLYVWMVSAGVWTDIRII